QPAQQLSSSAPDCLPSLLVSNISQSNSMSDASPPSIGIVVTAEQIPLLRDVIVAQQLDVYISDTQNTLLLDDQWKPWIRRIRPQRAHCTAAVWLMAPCYSWPDQHSHPRIRTIIAEQLQSCIQMAVVLGATGLVLPIEHVQQAFRERILYYLNLIIDQLDVHNLTLMLEVSDAIDIAEMTLFVKDLPHQYALMIASHRTIQIDDNGSNTTYYAHITSVEKENATDVSPPAWTNRYIVGAHESVSLIRKKIQALQEHIAQLHQPDIIAEASAESDHSSTLSPDDEIA
ncbi:MAG: hypothetical protein ACK5XN_16870, partial [Bacteroidota bacterium]